MATKQNYGFGELINQNENLLLHEIMGQWIFVDESNPNREPWRFHFDERIPPQDSPRNTNVVNTPLEVTYRDSSRDAEFRCKVLPPADSQSLNGCELFLDDEVIFSANYQDVGARRIRAFLGELPALISEPPGAQPEFHRGPDVVIGVRIETLPEFDDEP